MKIGLFFGTNTGNTEIVAEQLAEELIRNGFEVDVNDMASASVEDFDDYSVMIIAVPTWNDGEMQDDWDAVYKEYKKYNFSGKKVAFVGLGDQEGYPDNFLDAIGTLGKPVLANGGEIFGYWPTDSYDFNTSVCIADNGKLYGLGIDQDNQENLTEGRIKSWVAQIKAELS